MKRRCSGGMIKQKEHIEYYKNGKSVYSKKMILYNEKYNTFVSHAGLNQRFYISGERYYISTYKNNNLNGVEIIIFYNHQNKLRAYDTIEL